MKGNAKENVIKYSTEHDKRIQAMGALNVPSSGIITQVLFLFAQHKLHNHSRIMQKSEFKIVGRFKCL